MRGAMNSLPMAIWQVLTPRIVTAFARDGSVRNANARIVWVTVGLTGFMVVLAVVGFILVGYIRSTCYPEVCCRYSGDEGLPLVSRCPGSILADRIPFLPRAGRGSMGVALLRGLVVFPLATYLLLPAIGGLLAVAVGSLLGRAARTLAAYVDLVALTRREK